MSKDSTITTRSKITIFWTTNPADLGYDGTPSYGIKGAWKLRGGKTMSLKKAIDFPDELTRRISQGVYYSICYKHNGLEVARSDLQDVLYAAYYKRAYKD